MNIDTGSQAQAEHCFHATAAIRAGQSRQRFDTFLVMTIFVNTFFVITYFVLNLQKQ